MQLIKAKHGESIQVDDDDYECLSKSSWYVANGYARFRFKTQRFCMHHVVMGKPPKGYEIHHVDGNRLNNQKCNLKLVLVSHHRSDHAILNCQVKLRNKGRFVPNQMKPNAKQIRQTTALHGCGASSETVRGKDENRDVRTTTRGLRNEEKEVVSGEEEITGEAPHPKDTSGDFSP